MANKPLLPNKSSSFLRWMEKIIYLPVFAGVILLLVVCYLEFSGSWPEDEAPPPSVTDNGTAVFGPPEDSSPEEEPEQLPEPEEEAGIRKGVIESGATAGVLLQDWLPSSEVNAVVDACSKVYPLSRLRAGQSYTVYESDDGFSRFEYEIDDDKRLVVCRVDADWVATVEAIEYDVLLDKVEAELDASLFEVMSDIGETPVLAVRLADVFAWEINFVKDVQVGDSFKVLVEKRYRDGEFKGYGAMLAAEFVTKGKKFEAYRFKNSFGQVSYFNYNGESLKRAFLKAPLSFTRISSRFNLKRMHPILNTVRAHPAVDYAAPSGTPVKTVGNGVVTFMGWGKGAGNYISIKHSNGYESMYLHLSGFAKKLKRNAKVSQGTVIGYVGSTGYSTGPHLDFRMKKNGQFINPEKTLSPRDDSVAAKQMAKFKSSRDEWRLYLSGKKPLIDYTLLKENLMP